jgi:hypothetical protein
MYGGRNNTAKYLHIKNILRSLKQKKPEMSGQKIIDEKPLKQSNMPNELSMCTVWLLV